MKAELPSEVGRFEDIPNIGPAIAKILRETDLHAPSELAECDPYDLFERIQSVRGTCDLCLLDVLIAGNRFMNGEPAKPWWKYTAERKRTRRKSSGDSVETTIQLKPRFQLK